MEQGCSNRRQADVWSVYASCPFSQPLSFSLNDALVAQRSRSPSPALERRRSRSRSPSRDRDRERRRNIRSRSRSYSPRRGSRYSRSPRRSYNRYKERSRSPRDRHSPRGHATDDEEITDTYIRTVVAEVKGHGQKYEESLKEMEKDNPRYSFLTDRRVSSSYTPYGDIPADCQTGSTESTDFINHY
jgi:U2-associated protein SR140